MPVYKIPKRPGLPDTESEGETSSSHNEDEVEEDSFDVLDITDTMCTINTGNRDIEVPVYTNERATFLCITEIVFCWWRPCSRYSQECYIS